jgi:hypothetical protein
MIQFVEVPTISGNTTIARTAIATVESFPGGAKITLNIIDDQTGKPKVILTSGEYQQIRDLLAIE